MPIPVVAVAVAIAAVAGVSYALSQDVRTRRALVKRPVTPIRGLRDGEVVRVRGVVVAGEALLEAPLSGRKCVYYLATIDETTGNDSWREAAREERFVDFVLDDGTDRLHVCMSVPRVAVVHDVKTRSGTFDDANEKEEALLRRHRLRSTSLVGLNLSLRYTEGVVAPGEEVTALGSVRSEVRAGKRVLILDALKDGPLLLSDDPRAVHG